MRLLVVLLSLFVQVQAASAMCEGRDLIAEMQAGERAALDAAAAATVYPEGLLWRATKGESEITWFGTYHFPHEMTEAHLDALRPLIDAAEAVYLEISNDDHDRLQADIASDPSIMFITEGPTLPTLLGETDWATYKAAMEERAIPGFMAAKFKPIWAAMMLGIGPCETRMASSGAEGIDKRIGEVAAEMGKPSRSLEDFRTLLGLLDSFPQEDQLDMIRLFFVWSGDADDMAYTLRQRYLAQDTALIWEYSRMISLKYGGESAEADFAMMEEQLLIRRNRDWIARLSEEAAGMKVFAAVGAAHLPGEHGVLRMLAEEGYEIERLDFDP